MTLFEMIKDLGFPSNREYPLSEIEYEGDVDIEDLMDYEEAEGFNQARQEIIDFLTGLVVDGKIYKKKES